MLNVIARGKEPRENVRLLKDDLIEGYRRFRTGTWQAERKRFEALSRLGQRPRALIIACSDKIGRAHV